ncbi:hypothetical protein KZX47_10260 [Thermus sp. SYSU G05001]|uniref:Uncharacterized protein n=1 Tax=Thermus brevis TaxID=2862456 RepID=A0ABS6ZZS6_9DEIN|nr:hypothetical protein [Thermus brevis]MBW6395531.1 hypothetical protein [Thermus brevis]
MDLVRLYKRLVGKAVQGSLFPDLIPERRTVHRRGKVHVQTYWVKPDRDEKAEGKDHRPLEIPPGGLEAWRGRLPTPSGGVKDVVVELHEKEHIPPEQRRALEAQNWARWERARWVARRRVWVDGVPVEDEWDTVDNLLDLEGLLPPGGRQDGWHPALRGQVEALHCALEAQRQARAEVERLEVVLQRLHEDKRALTRQHGNKTHRLRIQAAAEGWDEDKLKKRLEGLERAFTKQAAALQEEEAATLKQLEQARLRAEQAREELKRLLE